MNVKCNVKKSVGIIFSGILFLPLFAFFAFFDVRTISDSPIINNDVVYYFLKAVMVFALVFFGFGLLIIFYRKKGFPEGKPFISVLKILLFSPESAASL